jgi:trehalose-6-phosphatase
MNSEDMTTSSRHEDEDKEESPTLPAETSDHGPTKSTREKKVVVVKPTKTNHKDSQAQGFSDEQEEDDNDNQ